MLWLLLNFTWQVINFKIPLDYVPTVEEYVSPHEFEPQLLNITGYVNPNGNKTANGSHTFNGSCAMNKENLGNVVALYDQDRNLIGFYDVNDIGGTDGLKNGKVVDIYFDNLDDLHAFFDEYGTKLYVQIIKADG